MCILLLSTGRHENYDIKFIVLFMFQNANYFIHELTVFLASQCESGYMG